MKNVIIYLGLIITIVALYGFAFTIANNSSDDGKKIFVDSKCTMCHTVQSAGIVSKKSDATDLSTVGTDKTEEFLMKYLKKEIKFNDKDHKSSFKGNEEDLKTLVEWLLTLKSE
ncbi:MAG: c-type cytochrome [Ignavibacteria bacterium]|nr:c-type cytochrome [Ignavibacteria bacterium]